MKRVQDRGDTQESSFWENLAAEVREDMDAVSYEGKEIRDRHGKSTSDWAEFRDRVVEIAREKDPNFLRERPGLGLSTRWGTVKFGSVRE